MPRDNNGLIPRGNQPRNITNEYRLAKHGAIQDRSDSTIGAFIHFLEAILLNSRLIRGNTRAFDADVMLENCVGGFNGDFVIRLVPVDDAEIVLYYVEIYVGEDHLIFDGRPDHARHLVAVEGDDGVADGDFRACRDTAGSMAGEKTTPGGGETRKRGALHVEIMEVRLGGDDIVSRSEVDVDEEIDIYEICSGWCVEYVSREVMKAGNRFSQLVRDN